MDNHDQQQKDFLSSLFPADQNTNHDGQQQSMPMFQYNQPPTMSMPQSMPPQLAMDMLGNMMQMQGIESQNNTPASPSYNPQSLLEQQFKLTQLQQLQQLQNQIFQQQIALISSQTAGIMQGSPSIDPRREQPTQFNGLPTPGSSTELHPQPSMEYVSPMILNNSYMDQPPDNNYHVDHVPPMVNHPMNNNYGPPRGSTSAPEHIAFRTSPLHHALPSPGDLDFDISPLTSPWLGAHQHSMSHGSSSNKRNASSSGDEGNTQPSRKRQSPAIRPTNPNQGKKYFRGSKSTNSTPLLRSTRSRKGSTAGEVVGDTPSPVDLSMPPPAPPAPQAQASSSSAPSNASLDQPPSSPNFNPHLTPVTPASIMNLGRLGINTNGGLAPPSRQVVPMKADAKGKAATASAKPKAATGESSRSKQSTRKTTGSLVSPSLKAILPAGATPPMSLNSQASPAPVVQVRKTSHKAAEQKRRDSLKTTFDDLRVLLPPIPLPTDEKYPDEPILPGALPPRGPPKAGGEGPNKGVSKLQLLMCGNDYIRQLKARVERRDEEIEKLRSEVKRLRLVMNESGAFEGGVTREGELDLEKDLDAVEAFSGPLGARGTMGMIEEDEGDDDPGEE
ncbi:hypothetical protein Hypma_005795 [Hypsizygus marmoreus]|uniref:BHLH domain-containing protein n=1 Tax=Hypsizygus marmoreus TaxID=39966 RepID=A0A369KGG3_HYPMA|nr:hypothetical protein Hypma_005795 [Hypsizygus marmoreus]